MSWITLSKNHTWEDVHKSLSLMKKKIILAQSTGKTAGYEYCVSKYMKKNFGILKNKILAQSQNFPYLYQEEM
jgi:hypothetical protein